MRIERKFTDFAARGATVAADQRDERRAGVGAAWLERGGVFVLANIRGGGEYSIDSKMSKEL